MTVSLPASHGSCRRSRRARNINSGNSASHLLSFVVRFGLGRPHTSLTRRLPDRSFILYRMIESGLPRSNLSWDTDGFSLRLGGHLKVYVVFMAVSSEPCRGDRRYLGTPKGSMVPEAARHSTISGHSRWRPRRLPIGIEVGRDRSYSRCCQPHHHPCPSIPWPLSHPPPFSFAENLRSPFNHHFLELGDWDRALRG